MRFGLSCLSAALSLGLLLGCSTLGTPTATSRDADPQDDGQATDAPAPGASDHVVLRGAEVVGLGRADVEIRGGRIVAVGVALAAPGAVARDLRGRFLVPAVVDSHVHLAYYPVSAELVRGGVAGAVDLAAPVETLGRSLAPLRLVASGPMITPPRGYPTESWGRDGYGLECAGRDACIAGVERLHALGARVIKLPVSGSPTLDDAMLAAVVVRAHALGLRVASHALGDAEAMRAARAGVDVLAHTPVEPLSDATVEAWRGRAVISTLRAFGGAASTIDNLRRLRAADVTVLYGTDLGNTHTARVDGIELALLESAGLDPAAVLAAATSVPAAYWGFADLGAIAPGRAACLLVLDRDPRSAAVALAEPAEVWIDGHRVDGS